MEILGSRPDRAKFKRRIGLIKPIKITVKNKVTFSFGGTFGGTFSICN